MGTGACMDTCVCKHVGTGVRECTGTRVHVCVRGSLRARGRERACDYLYACAWTCSRTGARVHGPPRPPVCACVCTWNNGLTRTCVCTRVCL